jgi:polysaccharide pyruvyl transferase WcaK-like protein
MSGIVFNPIPPNRYVRFVITHSWSLNMGDAAMLLTTVDMLKRMAPDSEITALVSHPDYTRERCPAMGAGVSCWPWPVSDLDGRRKESPLVYPFIFFGNMLSAMVYRLTKRKVFLFNGRYSEPLAKLFESDVVISPGGDFISPRFFFMTSIGEVLMSKILGKRLVLLAQSVGPFDDAAHRLIVGWALGMADLVIAREQDSFDHLSRMGVKDVRLTADLAFSFPRPAMRERKRRVVICPKDLGAGRTEYAERMSGLARRIRDEFGYDILLLASDQYDMGMLADIAAGLDGEAERIPAVLSPGEIADIIAGSEFVVSGRMHAIILGSLSATPFFAVSDGFKFRAVLDELSEGCHIGAIGKVLDAIRQSKRLGKEIASGQPEVRRRSEENASILAQKLRSWAGPQTGKKD